MLAPIVRPGDTIGVAAPSWLAAKEQYAPILAAMEKMGFAARPARNLYAHGWGYAASDRERADDLNELIRDPKVKLIFFGGGEGADDVLPLLDYAAAAALPKRWLSYSDGTSILNAVWSRAGLITYYGQMPGLLPAISEYDLSQFQRHILSDARVHESGGPWRTVCPGAARGALIGGYLDNFLFLANTGWFPTDRDYVLFLEDNERFFAIEHESALLARLEQSPIMERARGLLFGCYSAPVNESLLGRLRLLGERRGIPVAYCDDFGHGEKHAILPIGAKAALDATRQTLTYE